MNPTLTHASAGRHRTGRPANDPTTNDPTANGPTANGPTANRPTAADPTANERRDILARLLADTRLDAARATQPLPEVPPEHRPSPLPGLDLPLPPPAPFRAGLEPALRGRLAVRDYTPGALSPEELSALLAAAERIDALGWPEEREAGVGLELYCAVWRVAGLPTGLYRHRPGGTGLSRVASLPEGRDAEDLVLQREFAAAPVVLTVTGNLAGALSRHGSHGYRLLLSRAGAAAHAAWLAALRLGLVGTVFAGLLPHALRERAGADGYRRAALFAFAVGRPAVLPALIPPPDTPTCGPPV